MSNTNNIKSYKFEILKKIKTRFLLLLIILAAIYFNLLMPILVRNDLNVHTIYYDYTGISAWIISFVICINVLLILNLTIFLFSLSPKEVTVRVYTHPILVTVVLSFLIYASYSNISLSRMEIKENTNLLTTVVQTGSLTYCAAIVLCETHRFKFWGALLTLLFFTVTSFERELILYWLIPVLIRVDSGRSGTLRVLVLASFGFLFILLYKAFINIIKLEDVNLLIALRELDVWYFVLNALNGDNVHTGSLQLFYFDGTAPTYDRLSFWLPAQIGTLLDSEFLTNGQLATQFYTSNASGTGFSFTLEAWLNFGSLGLFVAPLFLTCLVVLCFRLQSAILVISVIVFAIKLQRSDMWPAIVILLMGPILMQVMITQLNRLNVFCDRISGVR